MYCPKCSQEQVSDETRFCSRCGFQLNVVKALLAEEGAPESAEIQKPNRSLRKRDVTIGATLMFVFAFIVAALTVSMPANHSSRILFLIVAWLTVSFLINIKPIIQFFIRGENGATDEKLLPSKFTAVFNSEKQSAALPDSQSIPADFMMPAPNTSEMVPPPSITEPTTNLLNK